MYFSKREEISFSKYLKEKIFVISHKRYKNVIQSLLSINPLPVVIEALRNMLFVLGKSKVSCYILFSETEAPCPYLRERIQVRVICFYDTA